MILLNLAVFPGKNNLFLVVLRPKFITFLAEIWGKNLIS